MSTSAKPFTTRMSVSSDEIKTEIVPMEQLVCDWVADRAHRNGFPFVVYCEKFTDDSEVVDGAYIRHYFIRIWAAEELTLP